MAFKYIRDHIPKETLKDRRPGYALVPSTITIHNTGNPSSTAAGERGWLTNMSNDRQASFHIVVDESEAIECIPLNECAWHAGDGSGASSGNRTSIGIEICESGNYDKTISNAIELVSDILRERSWDVNRLRRHYDWSGKICPRLMYDEGKWEGWMDFKGKVAQKLKESEPMTAAEYEALQALQDAVKQQSNLIDSLLSSKDVLKEWVSGVNAG